MQEVSQQVTQAVKKLKRYLNEKQNDEDECELYGRLLAKRLKSYSEIDRLEIMYEIDGVLLRKRRRHSSTSHVNLNNPSSSCTP